MTRKRSVVVCCSLASNNTSHDGYSQTSQRSGHPMQPCLPKELVEIYSTPTSKGWRKPKNKGICLVDRWEMSITMLGFNIYTRGLTMSPGRTRLITKTWKRRQNSLNYDNLDFNLPLLWSLMRLLASCPADPADRAYSLRMTTLPSFWWQFH